MPNNLDNSIARATKWSVMAEIFAKISPPIVNMILARLLAPEAFGIVASIAIITSFADIFTDAGFQKYIIQHEYDTEDQLENSLNVAFTSNFCVSVLTYFLITIFSVPLSRLIGCPGEHKGIIVASLTVLFTSFSSILLAKFKRELDFKSVFYVRVLSAFVPLIVTVPLAFFLKSYWAVVIGTLFQQAFIAIASLFVSKWKPHFVIDITEFKRMLSFSMWNLCETLSIWFAGQASVFIVANILNSYYLGLYKTATATINSYMAIITASITPVLFSALSRYQNEKIKFESTFFRFQSMLALIVLPMGAGIFVFREFALSILLGSKWTEATTLLGLWALVSSITIIFSNTACEVYRSKGQPKVSFFLQIAYLIVYIPCVYNGARNSFITLTYVSCFIRLLPVVLDIFTLHVRFGIEAKKVLYNCLWPVISTIAMCFVAKALMVISSHTVWQIMCILICILFYGMMICINKNYRNVLFSIPVISRIAKILDSIRKV